jgi:glutathione peroxidase
MALLAAVVPVAMVASLTGWTGKAGAFTEPSVAETAAPKGPNVLHHAFQLIDGTPTTMKAYEGKVVLIVNTASRCGLTPQYEALERLYREHQKEGLVVLGFPANNFMGQEPGTNEEILGFCTGEYGVTFPMAAKISVKGEDAHPLYRQLAAQPEPIGGEPAWNFTKFLVDRKGNVVARFEPRTRPDDPMLVSAAAAELKKE